MEWRRWNFLPEGLGVLRVEYKIVFLRDYCLFSSSFTHWKSTSEQMSQVLRLWLGQVLPVHAEPIDYCPLNS